MIRARGMVAAGVVLALSAAPAAAQWTRQPDGGMSCPNAYTAQRLNGELVMVCPPPAMTPQEVERFKAQDKARLDDWNRRYGGDANVTGPCPHYPPLANENPYCPGGRLNPSAPPGAR